MIVRGLMTLTFALALTSAANAALVLSLPGSTALTQLPSSGAATSCGGQNVSPPLSWSGVPDGTTSFAVVLFDIDAGAGRAHWVVYGIPGTATSIPAGYADGVKGVDGLMSALTGHAKGYTRFVGLYGR